MEQLYKGFVSVLLKYLLFLCILENEHYKHKTYFVVEGQGHK